MKTFFNQLDKAKEQVQLSQAAKQRMKVDLIEAIHKPVPTVSFWMRPMIAGLAVIFFVVLVGATSAAAKNSLPGDLLYPMKIQTEQVKGWLALTPEDKADVAIESASIRLDEAKQLEAKGKFNGKVKTNLEANFDRQTTVANKKIEQLKSENQDDKAEQLIKQFEKTFSKDDKDDSNASDIGSHVSSAMIRIRSLRKTIIKKSEKNENTNDAGNSNKNSNQSNTRRENQNEDSH